MQSHIRKVNACLAVTCHPHFWQIDPDVLRATAVTRGWNGYRNKNQHRKLTLEKEVLPPLLQSLESVTFELSVQCMLCIVSGNALNGMVQFGMVIIIILIQFMLQINKCTISHS